MTIPTLSRTHITTIAVPPETLKLLNKIAKDEGRIQYRIIQDALKLYLENKGKRESEGKPE